MLNWRQQKGQAAPPSAAAGPAAAPAAASKHSLAWSGAPSDSQLGEARAPRTLLGLLAQEGQLTEAQVRQVEAAQAKSGDFIGEILVGQGLIEEKSLLSFLAKYCKIPHLSLLDYLIDTKLLELIPAETCLFYRVLPIDKLGKNLTVAMVNPLDATAIEEVRRLCPDLRIKPILCANKHFEAVTARLFQSSGPGGVTELSASSLGLPPIKDPNQANKDWRLKQSTLGLPPLDEPAAAKHAAAPEAPPPSVEAAAPPPPIEDVFPPAEEPEEEPEELPFAAEVAVLPANASALTEDAMLHSVFSRAPVAAPAPSADSSPFGLPGEMHAAPAATAPASNTPPPPAPAAIAPPVPAPETAPGDLPATPPPAAATPAQSLIQEMTAAMVNSMRDTYAVLARRMELFRGIPPENVARIFAMGVTAEFEAGQIIFEKGGPGDKMYAVLIGSVDIFDSDRVIASLGRGDMFGEMAMLSNAPRSASARATAHSTLLALDKTVIHEVFPAEIALQLLTNIIVTLSARLRAANERAANA